MVTAATPGVAFYRRRRRWRLASRAVLLLAVSLVFTLALALVQPHLAVVGVFAGLMGLWLVCWRPLYGFYLMLSLTLLLEQYQVIGLDPLTLRVPFFLNVDSFSGIAFLVANPLELMMGTIVLAWLVQGWRAGRLSFRRTPLLWPTLLLSAALTLAVWNGLSHGGDLKVALWEVRALFYLCAMVLFVPSLIVTRRQVQWVIWISIATITVKALQGVWRWAVPLHRSLAGIDTITAHEDALFLNVLFVLLLSLVLLRQWRRYETLALLLVLPFLGFTYVATQRRAAMVALLVGTGVWFLLQNWRERRTLLFAALYGVLAVSVYSWSFWDSPNKLGAPVQAVRSVVAPDRERDRSSNEYRAYELANILVTMQEKQAQVAGIGFGQKYLIVVPLDRIDFPLFEYITHNEILWLWMKMGAAGLSVFALFVGAIIYQGRRALWALRDPYLKSVAMVAITLLIMQLVVSWADLQLTYYRNMVFLGTLIGVMISLVPVEQRERRQAEEATTARA